MAITREFFYTWEVHLNWDDVLSESTLSAEAIEGDWDIVPDYIPVHLETLSTTAPKPWITKPGYQLIYRLRFYKKITGGTASQNGTYWLDDDTIKNISISHTYGSKIKVGKIITKKTTTTRLTDLKNNDGHSFIFSVEATTSKEVFNLQTPFTVTADIELDNPNSQTASMKGVFPVVRFSTARKSPPVPDSFLDALRKEGNYTSNSKLTTAPVGTPYAYDHCKKKWIGLNIGPTVYEGSKSYSFFTRVTANTNGSKVELGTKEKCFSTKSPSGTYEEGTQVRKARKEITAALISNCTGSASVSSTGIRDEGDPVDLPPTPPSANLRWNPPTHRSSRSLPYGMQMDPLGGIPDAPEFVTTAELNRIKAAEKSLKNSLERGRIFQDSAGAEALNNNPDKLALPPGKQWGFRFMYNPTSFTYSTASTNNVDWTQGSSSPAILLNGNQNVTFEIYLNRIADMSYLKAYKDGSTNYLSDWISTYGRKLENEEIEGLLKRGTEYDIEFLYRVLNGDPLKEPLLFNTDYKGVTSDFGYTTGMPCWLYLHDNLRYYGSISNFTVNHAMFTVNMVPMLSTVSITFSRYPALWGSNNEAAKAADVKTSSDLKRNINAAGQSNVTSTPEK